jgi:hypothetical protein
MGQPPGVADVRLGPIAITTMPKHTFSVMTRSKSEQGLPAVARPTLGFAAVGPALLLACAIASNTGRGSDRWYGRTASVSSNDEVAPASGRSRSLRASPRRCCRSSGAAAPRPAAARLLLPACGTLDRFRDRAREGTEERASTPVSSTVVSTATAQRAAAAAPCVAASCRRLARRCLSSQVVSPTPSTGTSPTSAPSSGSRRAPPPRPPRHR